MQQLLCGAVAQGVAQDCHAKAALQSCVLRFCTEMSCECCFAGLFLRLLRKIAAKKLFCKRAACLFQLLQRIVKQELLWKLVRFISLKGTQI